MSMMPGAGGRAVSGRGTGWWPRSPSPSPGRGRCVAPMEVPLRSCLPGGSSRRDPGADTVRGQRPRCPPLSATGGGPLRVGRRPNAIMPPCASPGPAAAHYARRVAPRPPRQDRPWSLGPLITARTGPWILWPLLDLQRGCTLGSRRGSGTGWDRGSGWCAVLSEGLRAMVCVRGLCVGWDGRLTGRPVCLWAPLG